MINIIGLGATDKFGLTLEAINAMKNGNENFLRTKEHRAVEYFYDENIEFKSFDYLYEKENSFEDVYSEIVDFLIEESKNKDINYFVPGNPLIAERTVVKLIESSIEYNIIMGMSFIEPVLRAVKRDPSEGFKLLDGDYFNKYDIDTHSDIIVTQIYNKRTASDLKLDISEIYGDEYMIYLITDAGLDSEDLYYIPIYELDRVENINHQSAVYIPKNNEILNFRDLLIEVEKLSEKITDINHLNIKENNLDIESLENLSKMLILSILAINLSEEEGFYNFYEIIEKSCEIIAENGDFIKNTMEKRKDLRYNCDSLQKEGKVSLIRKLKSYNENALLRASNVIDDVSSIGFIWDEVDGALEKVSEELEEVYEAIKKDISYEISNELGDLIFSSVNLCRYLGFNPEDVLDLTIDKFIRRFEIMSELASKKNMKLEYLDLKDQDDLYNEAKHILEKD